MGISQTENVGKAKGKARDEQGKEVRGSDIEKEHIVHALRLLLGIINPDLGA
jgi:hypothetical protein